jgi:ribosomal-protein-alanine N-acetyltransferase
MTLKDHSFRASRQQASPLLIRQFNLTDLSQVVSLNKEVYGGYDSLLFTSFHEHHPRTILVAEMSGLIVGCVLGFKCTPMEGRVFWLAVRPGFQNIGIGRSLLEALIRIFRRLGALSVTLEVRISNRKAQMLYTSMGFETATICPGYYQDGEMAMIMRKYL